MTIRKQVKEVTLALAKELHPACWTDAEIVQFAISLDRIIAENPKLTDIRTAQDLILNLASRITLIKKALE